MFPRIIVEGDKEAATQLIPAAMNTLYKARAMAAANPGQDISGLTNRLGADAYAQVVLAAGMEMLTVYAAPHEPVTPELLVVGEPDVLSGAIRNGVIVDTGRKVLRAFNPTQQCWEFVLRKAEANPPGSFTDISRLAVKGLAPVTPDTTRSQYEQVYSSNYTGLMAKAVQIILGYGVVDQAAFAEFSDPEYASDVDVSGVQLQYDYRWARTHGIARGADGTPWLIEISVNRGVLAMPLPLVPLGPDSQQDVLQQAYETFGGLPTGEPFPSGATLKKEIQAGNILELIAPTGMLPFYGNDTPLNTKMSFTTAHGWAFNESGTVAHNIARYYPDARMRSAHMRIAFTIGEINTERQAGDPIAAASASLSVVKDDWCYHNDYYGTVGTPGRENSAFWFYEPAVDLLIHVNTRGPGSATGEKATGDVQVWFDGDEIHTVRLSAPKLSDTNAIIENYGSSFLGPGVELYDGSIINPLISGYSAVRRYNPDPAHGIVRFISSADSANPVDPATGDDIDFSIGQVVQETQVQTAFSLGGQQYTGAAVMGPSTVTSVLQTFQNGYSFGRSETINITSGVRNEGYIVPKGLRSGWLRMQHTKKTFTGAWGQNYANPGVVTGASTFNRAEADRLFAMAAAYNDPIYGGGHYLAGYTPLAPPSSVFEATVDALNAGGGESAGDYPLTTTETYETRFRCPGITRPLDADSSQFVLNWLTSTASKRTAASHSTFGTQHAAYSADVGAGSLHIGALLGGEPNQSPHLYSFVGYT